MKWFRCLVCSLMFPEHDDPGAMHVWKGQCPRCGERRTEPVVVES
jgi:rubredoxin